MNIMLTDLGTLSLDIQEIPALDATPADDFAGLLQQQLLPVLGGSQQAVEFNGYFSGFPGTEMSPGIVFDATPEAGWREYLGQQQIGADVDDGRLASTLAESDETPQRLSVQTASAAFIATAVAGESLPAGGNALPDEAITQPITRAATADTAALDSPGPVPTSTLISTSSRPARQAVAPEIAALTANLAGVNPIPGGQHAESAGHELQSPPIAPKSGGIAADARAGGESVATRDSSPRPLPVTADGRATAPAV
ncbi:MAG: hypothetical protein OEO18_12075, partial [Gammaproteobacteria bacterium]|nr:hypothetical protein [Gammaproteobacteria bacterium]